METTDHFTAFPRTFQEGMLSKRRLIFFDHEMAFSCNELQELESLQDTSRTQQKTDLVEPTSHVIESLGLSRKSLLTEQQSYHAIERYTQRNLTYDTDILIACLGVLSSLCKSHIWGMPLEISLDCEDGWTNFMWTSSKKILLERRANFPSWSWTGWRGNITFSALNTPKISLCRISVSTACSQWQTIREFMESDHKDRSSKQKLQPTRLRITAPRVYMEFLEPTYLNEGETASKPGQIKLISHISATSSEINYDVRISLLRVITQLEFDSIVILALHYVEGERRRVYESLRFEGLLFVPNGSAYERVGSVTLHRVWNISDEDYITGKIRKPLWMIEAQPFTIVVQ